MSRRRVVIALCAVVGAILGAVLGVVVAPQSSRYSASANVALLPAPDLTTVEASNFWEVLTRGQVTRTAAIVYGDPRWLPSAAKAANVAPGNLTLSAAALPETTMLSVTITADSAKAAESALTDTLNTATPDVTSLVAPYLVKILWPPQGNAVPVAAPGRLQVAAAAAFGGLLMGGGIGWLVARRRRDPDHAARHTQQVLDAGVPSR
ncbi:hypothetical protein [Mycolicibacterium hodleri]|uniref:Capsular polysaccharide biosynthesis protein n=1 Tax=Mycolicibacterium hodleri TaxID=49897 RepID=A0A502EBC1_9MYCO|nr:hypothetical protein [Mycolicibacterium hodleri]TPG34232.1 hypothetical protein EAH80_11580 [Mycolicibacterium hodleri]